MDIIKSFINYFVNRPQDAIIIVTLLIIGVLIDIYYPKFRGYFGEFFVKLKLGKLSKDKYIILNDIMIKDLYGTHQIDHIVLSNYGIFVIEMKNYNGLITGSEYNDKWCQHLGKNKKYFLNPINQNYGHIKSLSGLLNLEEKYFISIVCFSNQSKVNVKCNSIVTQVDLINREIMKFKDIKNDFNLLDIYNKLVVNNIKDKKSRKEHIKGIRSKIIENKKLENKMICPKCGGNLVERNGKYGVFLGCSNFPKCKYIKK